MKIYRFYVMYIMLLSMHFITVSQDYPQDSLGGKCGIHGGKRRLSLVNDALFLHPRNYQCTDDAQYSCKDCTKNNDSNDDQITVTLQFSKNKGCV